MSVRYVAFHPVQVLAGRDWRVLVFFVGHLDSLYSILIQVIHNHIVYIFN